MVNVAPVAVHQDEQASGTMALAASFAARFGNESRRQCSKGLYCAHIVICIASLQGGMDGSDSETEDEQGLDEVEENQLFQTRREGQAGALDADHAGPSPTGSSEERHKIANEASGSSNSNVLSGPGVESNPPALLFMNKCSLHQMYACLTAIRQICVPSLEKLPSDILRAVRQAHRYESNRLGHPLEGI